MRNLSRIAQLYILIIILAGAGLMTWNLAHLSSHNVWMLAALAVLASLSLILKVEGPTNRLHYNIAFLFYAFTFILLGTEAAIFVILISNLVEWAWHKYPWYIQSFNMGNYFIAMEGSGLVYRLLNPEASVYGLADILGILLAMAVFTLLNHLMVGLVVWVARGENFTESGVFDQLSLMIDFTMLCMGVGTALVWLFNPYAIVMTLVPLYMMYHTLRVPALERQSETDPKTGLFNAKYFERALKEETNRAERFDRPLTVVMADMDLLRNINNTYGHLAGDEVLLGVAKILKGMIRENDVVARFGGEEFAILMPESTPQNVFERVDAMREAIEKAEFQVQTSITPIKATMSFGIAGRECSGQSPAEIVHNADAALYHAKLKGRNRTFIYSNEAFQTLFSDAVENVTPAELSLEARLQRSDSPAEPSPLRQIPPVKLHQAQPDRSPAEADGQARAPRPGTVPPKAPVPTARKPAAWLVNLYISGLALAAVILLGLTFRPTQHHSWIGLALFAGVVILAEWFSIDLYVRDTAVSTSAAPMLAGILLFGTEGALILSLTFAAVALIKHRSKFSRFIFNASNQMLAGLIYTGLIELTGMPFTQWPMVVQLLLALLSAGVVFLSTTSAVAFAIYLDSGIPFRQVWDEKFRWLGPYYFAMGMIAYGLIFGYQTNPTMGTAVVLVPLLLLRFSQKQYIDRTRTIVGELQEKNHNLEKVSLEITRQNEALLDTLAVVIDIRDPYVLSHSRQVSHYSTLIAQKLGLPKERVEHIRKASLLHDIGKLGIPGKILKKPGALTPDEYCEIKKHVTLGTEILATAPALSNVLPIVRHHHERYDGEGYPDRLAGQAIPLEARIVGLADAVEAMASDRPYRDALRYEEIVQEIRSNLGTQFDPQIAKAFLEILEEQGEALLVNTARKIVLDERNPLFDTIPLNIEKPAYSVRLK